MHRKTQERCGGFGRENPAAFPKAGPIFQQPFSLPESAQTLAGRSFRAAGKSGSNSRAASKLARKPFHKGKCLTATAFSSFLNYIRCNPNSKQNRLWTKSLVNRAERAKPLQRGRNPFELKMAVANSRNLISTFIDSGSAGKPCEPNLRIENAAICDLLLGALSL